MTRKPLLLLPAFFLLGGCLVPLPGGSGLRLSSELVSADNMPKTVAPLVEQAKESALTMGEVVAGTVDPILGALLYQFILRPLRRRYGKKDPAPTEGTS